MICYLLCSPALYTVERYSTYQEALARLEFFGREGWSIYEAKLVELET